jgi:hypothetical protein
MTTVVPLDSLFEISSGHQLALVHLKETSEADGIAYVARSHRNNGITAWVEPITDLEPAPAGCISVALRSRNQSLASFVQPRPFYTSYHVAILTPLQPMTLAAKLWYCGCIESNRFRFNFGRQANRTLGTLKVPSEIPAWVESTAYRRMKRETQQHPPMLHAAHWTEYRLVELFDLQPGRYTSRRDLPDGPTPFIAASDADNGVGQWVAVDPDWPGGQITVANNGSVGSAFYQPRPFTASRDVTVLSPKFSMTAGAALFICTVIRLEAFRFNYARKWTVSRMHASTIRLPAISDLPDTAWMDRYIRSLNLGQFLRDFPEDGPAAV